MDRFYKERLQVQKNLIQKSAPLTEVNRIIEMVREELRNLIPNAMEVCILLLDPDAQTYTSPLQCALYETPVDCQSCKRDRPAVQKAVDRKKPVVIQNSEPVTRPDNSTVAVGSECAIPVFVENRVLAVVSVVIQPLTRFSRHDFFIVNDVAEILGTFILTAKRQWETTQEKIRISRKLAHLSPFVPESVRQIADQNPDLLVKDKTRKDITVLFLDLEGYTTLSADWPEAEVNAVIERMFSSFVDPIHRSHGDINETAGDALMIIFKNHDPVTNAVNSVKAAFEIMEQNRSINRSLPRDMDPIEVNIGINSGSALVGMTRFKGTLSTRMTFTASGSVTNIASRLSDLAKGGDILIGEETKKMVQEVWPVYDRGLVALKGVKTPLQVYSMLKKKPWVKSP
ncbi:MAG: GAF domain-containing protein [Desulfobacterales bacterium]|nr:GAF domain-containing protein [Desulfobacterales bacterium]